MWFETILITLVASYGIVVTLYIFLVLAQIAIEVRIQDDSDLRANQMNLNTDWTTSKLINPQHTRDYHAITHDGLSERPFTTSIQSSPNTTTVTTSA